MREMGLKRMNPDEDSKKRKDPPQLLAGYTPGTGFSAPVTAFAILHQLIMSSRGSIPRLASSADYMQRPLPAPIAEEVQRYVGHPGQIVANPGLFQLRLRRLERPIVKTAPLKPFIPALATHYRPSAAH
jgi:hypothetical protein